MATKITKSPTHKVSNHSVPERDGNILKSTWKIPSEETKDSNHRAQTQRYSWDLFYTLGKRKNLKITRGGSINSLSTTSSSVNINNFVTTSTQNGAKKGAKFTRKSFYPYASRLLTHVDHNVRLDNSHKDMGPVSTTRTTFSAPGKPSIGSWKFDTDTGTVSVKITAVKSTPRAERKLTKYTWKVQKGKYVASTQKFKPSETKVNVTKTFAGGELTLSYDCQDYQALKDGELYLCMLTALSQGFAGKSESLTKKFVVAPPAAVTITKNPTITTGEGGRVTVPIRTNRKSVYKKVGNSTEWDYYANPIDGLILQGAIDVEAKNAASIPGTAWTDLGAVDDGDCQYLTVDTGSVTPSQNNYSYVRVKSWRFDAECEPLCRYSNVKALSSLRTTETAADDECAILELTSMADGQGANLLIGYDKIGKGAADDADGTEISWADSSTAWESTKRPSTFEVTWSTKTDGIGTSSPAYPYKDIWNYVQRVYVDELEEGAQYWFRARRYNDDANGNRTYGKYCTKIWGTETAAENVKTNATLTPTVKPTQVTLSAPQSIPVDSDIPLTWTYDGGDQTAFRVFLGSGGRVVDSSNTGASAYLLKRETYEAYVADDNTVRIMVAVSTSKRRDTFTESGWVTVTFAEAPVLEADVPTVTAQPATVNLYSTTSASSVSMTVSALGSSGDDAIGIDAQVAGDDVWTSVVMPTWEQTTWADTAWYAENVTPAVEASDDALAELPLVTESFVGGTSASLVDVNVSDDEETQELRPYVLVQPAGVPGAYMLATLDVDGTQWELSSTPVWCNALGVAEEGGDYLRFPWPLALYDDPETEADEQAEAFEGCAVTLTYMPQGDEYDAAWDDYAELRSASDALTSAHDPSEVVYVATVEIPAGVDFRDSSGYELTATVVSADSGLVSNVAEASFEVLWAHQAVAPEEGVVVTPFDVTDENGTRTIGASIQLAQPAGSVETDVADVWRVSGDGAQRIAEGCGLTDLVTDNYAPFGDADLAYRVVVRTADGDTDWVDFPYEMRLSHTRFDFGETYIELPFNLGISHSYTKDSEQRQHLGETLARGYWGSAHGRTFTISSDLIKASSREQRALLHELGRHMGPVLVRTPDGCCMEAEVTPDTSISYDSLAVPVSIRGTEIQLTAEHMAEPPEDTEEEEP